MSNNRRAHLRSIVLDRRVPALLLAALAGACDHPGEPDAADEAELAAPTRRDAVFETMPQPVGLWHLDEDCSDDVVLDDSGAAAHGQRLAGAGCVAGKTDRAASFDGVDDRIQVADRPAFHFTTAMTAAAWVKPGSTVGLRTIVNKWYAADSYSLIVVDGKYNFSIALAGDGAHHQVEAPATAGVWAHVAGVYDGTRLSLYVNGALVASKLSSTLPRALQDSPRPLVIGNHPTWNAFAGQIDEVRLYGAALTAAEVKSLTRNIYHVSRSGLDTNPGTKARPFRTLAKGGLVAQAGDTVLVREGVYDVGFDEPVVKLDNLGTAEEHILFSAYPGETPTLDGSKAPADTDLMQVRGRYIDIVGLELAYAKKTAISLYKWQGQGGRDIWVRGNEIHHSWRGAVYPNVDSSGLYFEANDVHHNVRVNEDKSYCHNGGWPSTVNLTGAGDVVVGNQIHENWGEGIGAYGSGHIVTDNVLHDNYSVDIYVNNIEGSEIARNFVYSLGLETFKRYFYPDGQGCPLPAEQCACSLANKVAASAVGIALANEAPGATVLRDNEVVNNIVIGPRRAGIQLTSWAGSGPLDMNTTRIVHNTVVSAAESEVFRLWGASVPASDGESGLVGNNIFVQLRGDRAVGKVMHKVDLVFTHNNWFGGNAPPPALGSGPGDVLGDPQLVGAGLAPEQYQLKGGSPNIDAGAALGVLQDFWGDPRPHGAGPDIGADERVD